ncbi:MAG: PAS domain S-box protein [Pirellulaceae bacterium]|nr:PAS domain S-box protein [Pirellulaceae bacterium]
MQGADDTNAQTLREVETLRRRVAELEQAEAKVEQHLRYLEDMERIDRGIRQATDLDQMFEVILDEVLSILDCDRAWLLYPCDPRAKSVTVPMERTRPQYPGALAAGQEVPVTPDGERLFLAALAWDDPVVLDPRSGEPVPDALQTYLVQSLMVTAVRPKSREPWLFGVHQCSHARVWTDDDQRLFNDIGHRITDGLTAMLAMRELRESEAKLNRAQQVARVGSWYLDLRTNHLRWSDETYRLFSIPVGTPLTNESFLACVHPADRQLVETTWNAALEHEPYDIEHRILVAGEERWVHEKAEVEFDEQEDPVAGIGTVQDITEHKQAERALRESEERFRILFEEARDGILLANPETKQLGMGNRAICTMLGYSKEEFARLRIHDIHPEEHVPHVVDQFDKQARGEVLVAEDIPMKRKDGSVFYADVASAPMRIGGETVVMGQFHDMTERKRTQDELARANEQVRRLNLELEKRVEQRTAELRSANDELEAFAYSVSHDLRAPLRAMEGFANALVEDYADRLDPDGHEYCQHIVDSATRMDALISDLLAYSRLGRAELRPHATSMQRAVTHALDQLESEIRAAEARVVVKGVFPVVVAHHSTLVQVVTNLISNAVKFVAAGGRSEVKLWAETRGKWVRLWVEDSGIGIAPEYQDRVFRVFERLHGIESYPGTGIGLAIVDRAVNRMGGRRGVESRPGMGSRFWVEFKAEEEGHG